MTLPHYFHLGIDAEDYVCPTVTVSYDFGDYLEGLPDDELCGAECEGDFAPKLPEECPDMIVIDQEDFGDE